MGLWIVIQCIAVLPWSAGGDTASTCQVPAMECGGDIIWLWAGSSTQALNLIGGEVIIHSLTRYLSNGSFEKLANMKQQTVQSTCCRWKDTNLVFIYILLQTQCCHPLLSFRFFGSRQGAKTNCPHNCFFSPPKLV